MIGVPGGAFTQGGQSRVPVLPVYRAALRSKVGVVGSLAAPGKLLILACMLCAPCRAHVRGVGGRGGSWTSLQAPSGRWQPPHTSRLGRGQGPHGGVSSVSSRGLRQGRQSSALRPTIASGQVSRTQNVKKLRTFGTNFWRGQFPPPKSAPSSGKSRFPVLARNFSKCQGLP